MDYRRAKTARAKTARVKTMRERRLREREDNQRAWIIGGRGLPKAWTAVERATADKQLLLWQTEPLWRKNFFVYTLKFRRSVGGFFLHKEDRNSILKLFCGTKSHQR